MAGQLWPVDPVSGAPSYDGQTLRQTAGPLAGAASGRPFGCGSGVWQSTPASTVAATSTTWTVTPFGGALDVEASNVEGCYLFAFDANVTGTVNAADATNQRVDSLFVQMDDPAAGDGTSAPAVRVIYTAGTPGASGGSRGAAGGPPAIPARAFELAQIQVPKSGGGSPSVTITAVRVVALGGVQPIADDNDHPPAPQPGTTVYNPDPVALEVYDGSNWRFPDGRKHGQTSITVGSGQTSNTLNITFNTPFPAAPHVFLTMDGGGLRMGVNTSSVTAAGFVLNCWTSDNRTLGSAQTVTVTWVAFPS